MLNCKSAVIPFAIIIDKLPIKIPYKSQSRTPINNITYIVSEIPSD
jgi:hypothetical protein